MTYTQNDVLLLYTTTEGIVTIYIDDVANNTILPSCDALSFATNGIYNITIRAVDTAGNVGQQTVILVIDVPATTTTTTTIPSSTPSSTTTTSTPSTTSKPRTTTEKDASSISALDLILVLSIILTIKRIKKNR